MNTKINTEDSYHSLLLLEELSKEETLSQRDLSKRLGIALGLVNSYVKNMIAKGYVRVSSFPKNRYNYLLTPTGIAEKSRLTYQHLHYFTNLYTTARKDFSELFSKLEKTGVKKVLFCGVDEVAEIAYLSLQETDLQLSGIMDEEKMGTRFFSYTVSPIEEIGSFDFDMVIVTSFKKRGFLVEQLKGLGIAREKICCIKD
ncbi:MAG: winged helix-turn-helix transcriptional regulator [Deltaproteobacteria bacterium]|nr:winged helix-turn-helix transcriptional regulator [Deltaproteobacteria bacterium]